MSCYFGVGRVSKRAQRKTPKANNNLGPQGRNEFITMTQSSSSDCPTESFGLKHGACDLSVERRNDIGKRSFEGSL